MEDDFLPGNPYLNRNPQDVVLGGVLPKKKKKKVLAKTSVITGGATSGAALDQSDPYESKKRMREQIAEGESRNAEKMAEQVYPARARKPPTSSTQPLPLINNMYYAPKGSTPPGPDYEWDISTGQWIKKKKPRQPEPRKEPILGS